MSTLYRAPKAAAFPTGLRRALAPCPVPAPMPAPRAQPCTKPRVQPLAAVFVSDCILGEK